MRPGQLTAEVYDAIHAARRDHNEAACRGQTTRADQARARLNDLTATGQFIFGTYN